MRIPTLTHRQRLAQYAAKESGRHSVEHLIHSTDDAAIRARLAIQTRIAWEIRHSEAFHRAGRNPWTEPGSPRHAVLVAVPSPF